jgi:hypothetical protein
MVKKMRKWMIRATMTILVLLSMAGIGYGASSTATVSTVNVQSTIGITASNNLDFNVLSDGGWYNANYPGGVTITSTSSVPVNIQVRSDNIDPGIQYLLNGGYYVYTYDTQVYSWLYPSQSTYFSAMASAAPGTQIGTHNNIWTWTAIATY